MQRELHLRIKVFEAGDVEDLRRDGRLQRREFLFKKTNALLMQLEAELGKALLVFLRVGRDSCKKPQKQA